MWLSVRRWCLSGPKSSNPLFGLFTKTEENVGLGEALGTELDGCELVTSERFRMLRQGLAALLRRRRCSGRALERGFFVHVSQLLPLHSALENGQIGGGSAY